MDNIIDIISRTPLFSGLDQIQLREIRNIAVERRFTKGEIIFSEGDAGDGFYVVVEGMVKVYKISLGGKEQILHIFDAGEPLGEVPVFAGKSFPANSEAITRSTLLYFPRTSIVDLIASNPSLALNMLAVLSTRLRQFTVQVENLSLKEVPGRLAGYLLYLSEEQGREDSIDLNISKGQLASLLGTIPETLSRIFAKMSSQNLIEVQDRHIRFLNRNGLVSLAEYGKVMD